MYDPLGSYGKRKMKTTISFGNEETLGNDDLMLVQWSLGATLEIKHSNRKMSPSFDQELDKFNFRLEV